MNQRRIKKEIEELKKIYPELEYNNKIIIINNKKFIFDSNYPFNKPQVFINEIKYFNYVKPPVKIQKILDKKRYNCLCCNSILCNWNVSNKIEDILDEIKYFNKTKTNIKYILILDELFKKYIKIDEIKIMINDFLIEN